MFYSNTILTKKGPLGRVWIAATVGDRTISKSFASHAKISQLCQSILAPQAPFALRLSAHLMLGVTRVYARKFAIILNDVNEVAMIMKLQRARATRVTAKRRGLEHTHGPRIASATAEGAKEITSDPREITLPSGPARKRFKHAETLGFFESTPLDSLTLEETLCNQGWSSSDGDAFSPGDASAAHLPLDLNAAMDMILTTGLDESQTRDPHGAASIADYRAREEDITIAPLKREFEVASGSLLCRSIDGSCSLNLSSASFAGGEDVSPMSAVGHASLPPSVEENEAMGLEEANRDFRSLFAAKRKHQVRNTPPRFSVKSENQEQLDHPAPWSTSENESAALGPPLSPTERPVESSSAEDRPQSDVGLDRGRGTDVANQGSRSTAEKPIKLHSLSQQSAAWKSNLATVGRRRMRLRMAIVDVQTELSASSLRDNIRDSEKMALLQHQWPRRYVRRSARNKPLTDLLPGIGSYNDALQHTWKAALAALHRGAHGAEAVPGIRNPLAGGESLSMRLAESASNGPAAGHTDSVVELPGNGADTSGTDDARTRNRSNALEHGSHAILVDSMPSPELGLSPGASGAADGSPASGGNSARLLSAAYGTFPRILDQPMPTSQALNEVRQRHVAPRNTKWLTLFLPALGTSQPNSDLGFCASVHCGLRGEWEFHRT